MNDPPPLPVEVDNRWSQGWFINLGLVVDSTSLRDDKFIESCRLAERCEVNLWPAGVVGTRNPKNTH